MPIPGCTILNQTARSATGVFCMVKYPNPNRGHNPAWGKKKQPSLVSRDHLSISHKQPHNNNISNLFFLFSKLPKYIFIFYPSKGLISIEKKKKKNPPLLSFTYRYMTLSLSLSLSLLWMNNLSNWL